MTKKQKEQKEQKAFKFVKFNRIYLSHDCKYDLDPPQVGGLVCSLREHGLFSPFILVPSISEDAFFLVDGHRRWVAINRIHSEMSPEERKNSPFENVPAYILHENSSTEVAEIRLRMKLLENPPNDHLLGEVLADKVKESTKAEVAKELHTPQTRLSLLLRLAAGDLPYEINRLLHQNIIGTGILVPLGQMDEKAKRSTLQFLVDVFVDGYSPGYIDEPPPEEKEDPRPSLQELQEKYEKYLNMDREGLEVKQVMHLYGILKALHFAIGKEVTEWNAMSPKDWGLYDEENEAANKMYGVLGDSDEATMRVVTKVLAYGNTQYLSGKELDLLNELRKKAGTTAKSLGS